MRSFAPAFLLLLALPVAGQEATFTPVGFLPDGEPYSPAFGISSNGLIVVGQGHGIQGGEGYIWDAGVMTGVGDLPGGIFSSNAWAASEDGSVIVGSSYSDNASQEAFRWEAGVMAALGDLPGGSFHSIARDVSADGSVVVGQGSRALGEGAFRWEAGVMELLPDLPGPGERSAAYAVSADGRMVTGWGENLDELGEAIRWVDGVPEGLGIPEGFFYTRGDDISADGSVVVGLAFGTTMTRGFVWREGEGMHILPDLPGGSEYREAFAVSGDGRVIGGTASGPSGFEATLWIDGVTVISLKDMLETLGLELTGWTLSIVADHGLSYDGTAIAGPGINPDGESEGWRATLPPFPVANASEVPEADDPAMSVYPNPVRDRATVRVVLATASVGRVTVSDVLGREIAILHEGLLTAGAHSLTFSAENLPAGVYVLRAEMASGQAVSQTITLLR